MDLNLIQNKLTEKLPSWGYELCSLTYKKDMGRFVLGVVVDRIEPIDMNAIVEISEKISTYLDEIDTSSDIYTLDVSSLGAEKPLKIDQLHHHGIPVLHRKGQGHGQVQDRIDFASCKHDTCKPSSVHRITDSCNQRFCTEDCEQRCDQHRRKRAHGHHRIAVPSGGFRYHQTFG